MLKLKKENKETRGNGEQLKETRKITMSEIHNLIIWQKC